MYNCMYNIYIQQLEDDLHLQITSTYVGLQGIDRVVAKVRSSPQGSKLSNIK